MPKSKKKSKPRSESNSNQQSRRTTSRTRPTRSKSVSDQQLNRRLSTTASKAHVRLIPRPKENGASKGETLWEAGETFRSRWFVKGLIGQGGYGEIYLALDIRETVQVAIKTENRIRHGRTSKRMILEQRVLLHLQGKPHVPRILASGHDDRINFIVMELLSVNVGDLKKLAPYKRLSRSTVGRILMQGIAALRECHYANYLHRDVKPANLCFGLTSQTRHILMLVDFGLVRRFRHTDGTLRKPRLKAGFRGTSRYVSVRVHERLEQCPVDDLVSLTYSGIELLMGELPWKLLSKHEDIKVSKEELRETAGEEFSYLATGPPAFQQFCQVILNLEPTDRPNYTALQSLLTEMIGEKDLSDPYDWENKFRETLETTTTSTDSAFDEKK